MTPTIPDALDNAERVLAVARSLKACGNRITSFSVYDGERHPGVVRMNEIDFRRHFKGQDVTEYAPPGASLSIVVEGVEVACFIDAAVARPMPRRVTL